MIMSLVPELQKPSKVAILRIPLPLLCPSLLNITSVDFLQQDVS
jgi:hypothetical protein